MFSSSWCWRVFPPVWCDKAALEWCNVWQYPRTYSKGHRRCPIQRWWNDGLNYSITLTDCLFLIHWSGVGRLMAFQEQTKRHLQQRNVMVIGTCKNRSSAWNLFSNTRSDLISLVNIKRPNSMLWLSVATKEFWGLLWIEHRGLNKPQFISVSGH